MATKISLQALAVCDSLPMNKPAIPTRYLSEIGRKGGLAKGPTKVRGDSSYYAKLALISVANRKAKQAK